MLEATESTLRSCFIEEPVEKGKDIVDDSGFCGRVRKDAAEGESNGVGISEDGMDATAMVCGGSSYGLSFSWWASMTTREERGVAEGERAWGEGTRLVPDYGWVVVGGWY